MIIISVKCAYPIKLGLVMGKHQSRD